MLLKTVLWIRLKYISDQSVVEKYYRMKLLRLAPAKFIHFGTTREILELMNGGVDEYHYLGWSRKVAAVSVVMCLAITVY